MDESDLTHAQLCLGFPLLHETMETGGHFPRMRTLCDDFVSHGDILPYVPCGHEGMVGTNNNNKNNINNRNSNSSDSIDINTSCYSNMKNSDNINNSNNKHHDIKDNENKNDSLFPHKVITVHSRTTEGVMVTVSPQYMGQGVVGGERQKDHHCWCITVRLHNIEHPTLRVRYHHWGMMTSEGEFRDTKGVGVCDGHVVGLSHDR